MVVASHRLRTPPRALKFLSKTQHPVHRAPSTFARLPPAPRSQCQCTSISQVHSFTLPYLHSGAEVMQWSSSSAEFRIAPCRRCLVAPTERTARGEPTPVRRLHGAHELSRTTIGRAHAPLRETGADHAMLILRTVTCKQRVRWGGRARCRHSQNRVAHLRLWGDTCPYPRRTPASPRRHA
jgi:hypothetical protein